MKNGMKIFGLLIVAFLFGGMTLTVLYATGEGVISEGPYMKMVSHSEYATGDNGQIIARLVDWKGDAIVVDACYASIYYPNKTLYVDNLNMTDGGFTGDHYYNFVAPAVEGVYEYQARCEYTLGITYNASVTNSFQVVPAYNKIDVMEEQISYVVSGVAAINVTVLSINDSLNTVGQNVLVNTDLLNNLTIDLDGVQTAVDINTELLNNVTVDVNGVQVTVDLNSEKLDNVTIDIAGVQTVVDINSEKLDNLSIDAAAIQAAVDALNYTAEFNSLETRFDTTDSYLANITTDIDLLQVLAIETNQTTHNIYNYVTGTLATNVNNILSQIGVINATVNRIETNTVEINDTVSTIQENQERVVHMTTF